MNRKRHFFIIAELFVIITVVLLIEAEEVHMFGDCNSPGSIREAVEAGEQAGREFNVGFGIDPMPWS